MYTDATLNPSKSENIKSAKRIYLDHKEKVMNLDGLNIKTTNQSETIVANIYFTNVPLDGKKGDDIETAHQIAAKVAKNLYEDVATSSIKISTKVREKDQVIVSTMSFEINSVDNDDSKSVEKNIWHPLKMETLLTLCTHPTIGDYIPLTDHQKTQISEYIAAQ